jgi:arylformamidase
MASAKQLIDVGHTIESGMITYPGLPAPAVEDFLTREASRTRYAPGVEFHIARISMVANTGTYLDAPSHRYQDGVDVSGLPLTSVADLEGVVVRAPHANSRVVDADAFARLEVRRKAVLIHTGWDTYWRTAQYFEGSPFLTERGAEHLASAGAALVGIDSLNIDDPQDARRPAHSILLRRAIPVLEHLCGLGDLPEEGFRFFAVPVKFKGVGTFPVRAFAIVG